MYQGPFRCAVRGRAYVGDFELRPVNTNDGCRVRVRVVLELFRFPAGDVVAEWTEAVRLRLLKRLQPECERQVRVEMRELMHEDACYWTTDLCEEV